MKNTIKVINELKQKGLIKDYAIGGAIAVLRWVEPFFTRDLDIFIIPIEATSNKRLINLSAIYDYLKRKRYNKWVGQWLIIEGIPVEFIPAQGLAEESVEKAREIKFARVKTKVITPEYLIALLLLAGRQKDKLKVEMLLKQTKIDFRKLEEILKKYDLEAKLRPFL